MNVTLSLWLICYTANSLMDKMLKKQVRMFKVSQRFSQWRCNGGAVVTHVDYVYCLSMFFFIYISQWYEKLPVWIEFGRRWGVNLIHQSGQELPEKLLTTDCERDQFSGWARKQSQATGSLWCQLCLACGGCSFAPPWKNPQTFNWTEISFVNFSMIAGCCWDLIV